MAINLKVLLGGFLWLPISLHHRCMNWVNKETLYYYYSSKSLHWYVAILFFCLPVLGSLVSIQWP